MKVTLYKRGNYKDMIIFINGQRAIFKRKSVPSPGEPSNECAVAECDGNVEIAAYFVPPLLFSHWFLNAFLFWLAGFFGLFSPSYSKMCFSLRYTMRATIIKDETFVLDILPPSNPKSVNRAVTMYASVPVEESGTGWVREPKAKKRRKVYIGLTILFWVGVIAATVATLCVLILG